MSQAPVDLDALCYLRGCAYILGLSTIEICEAYVDLTDRGILSRPSTLLYRALRARFQDARTAKLYRDACRAAGIETELDALLGDRG